MSASVRWLVAGRLPVADHGSSPGSSCPAGSRLRPPRPGRVSRQQPGRQCVMVMLTCPTFVIHLCDNWDRCFHVHPQCVHNQGQRLVNTLPAYSGPTSSQHQSTPTTATAASVLCDNNHQVWILPPVVTSSTQQTWSEETVTMSHLTFSYSSLPTTTSHHQVSSTLQSASHTPLSLFSFYDL